MNLSRDIFLIINKPFPDFDSWSDYAKYLAILSVFITFFLYVFKPFGLSSLESNAFLICLGFGAMTFLGAVFYEVTLGSLFTRLGWKEKWTLGKWILNNLGTMLFISMANFIFARLIIIGFIDWELLPTMIYSTFMIGIIPISVLGGFLVLRGEKKYQHIAKEINELSSPKTTKENDLELFHIAAHQIKYIEALQNYVKIGFLTNEGELKILTERITLKEVIQMTDGSSIAKCHRSFLVNREAIVSATGNAQGLLLTLSDCDKIIPVSRMYVPIFRR